MLKGYCCFYKFWRFADRALIAKIVVFTLATERSSIMKYLYSTTYEQHKDA